MSTAYINPFAGLDDTTGAFRGGAQCFQGDCADAVQSPSLTTSFPSTPHYVVPPNVGYIAVYLSAPGQVYAGPNPAEKSSKGAVYPEGWWPMAVRTGDSVFVRDLI